MKPIIPIIISSIAFTILITIAISLTDIQTGSTPRIETEHEPMQNVVAIEDDSNTRYLEKVKLCREWFIANHQGMLDCLDRAEEFKWQQNYLANPKDNLQDIYNEARNASELTDSQRMALAIQNPERHDYCYSISTTQIQYDSCLRTGP